MAHYSTVGRHVTMDLRGAPYEKLNDSVYLKRVMIEAAHRCGATIVGEQFVKFDPQGVTGVLVLSESHLSIHTYPEEGFAAIDCYTCGEHVDPAITCVTFSAARWQVTGPCSGAPATLPIWSRSGWRLPSSIPRSLGEGPSSAPRFFACRNDRVHL